MINHLDTALFKTILYLSIFDSKENLQLPQSILRTGDLQPENIESLALHAISLILLPGLMRSCNIKNPLWRKRNGFNVCEIMKGFL